MTFDQKKPTVLMLGRWQPWHPGHRALFLRALEKTGQVLIAVRDVQGVDDNPFDFRAVMENIVVDLEAQGYPYGHQYLIEKLPNIVDISYGRGVGYTFTEHDLGEVVHDISATKIRAEMRAEGRL